MTVHSKPFKDLIEVLNAIVHEVTTVATNYSWEFAVNHDSVSIEFHAGHGSSIFSKYDRVEIGLNLEHLNVLLKAIGSSDILSVSISEADRQTLCIEDSRGEKSPAYTTSEMRISEFNHEEREPPVIDFDVSTTMKTGLFFKTCKEMNSISDYIKIKFSGNKLIFSCENIGGNEKIYAVSNDWDDNIESKIAQGVYEVRNLMLFSKLQYFTNQVSISMKDGGILAIQQTITDFVDLIYFFNPVDEKVLNQSYDFSDDDEIFMK